VHLVREYAVGAHHGAHDSVRGPFTLPPTRLLIDMPAATVTPPWKGPSMTTRIRDWQRQRLLHRVLYDLHGIVIAFDQRGLDDTGGNAPSGYPTGQIDLQNHRNPLYFKNIYIKELLTQK
jgi:hypothetical protein